MTIVAQMAKINSGIRTFATLSVPPLFSVLLGCAQPPRPASAPATDRSSQARLDPELIQKIVRANFGAMRRCYEDGLRLDPRLAGRVSVRFVIGLDGRVTSALDRDDAAPDPLDRHLSVGGAPHLSDRPLSDCVVAVFRKMVFPPPKGGTQTVTYPLVSSPSE